MERLTKLFDKEKYSCYDIETIGIDSNYFLDSKEVANAINKLGHTEDIEEKHNMSIDEMDAYITEHKKIEQELGIKLSVLFKLSKAKNVYAYGYNEIIQCALIRVDFEEIVVWNGITKTHYPLCNYGKSFALTKEELK